MPLPAVVGLWDKVQGKRILKSAGYICSLVSLIHPQKVNLGDMRDRSLLHLKLSITILLYYQKKLGRNQGNTGWVSLRQRGAAANSHP